MMKSVLSALMLGACTVFAALTPTLLKCEYRVDPLGVDVAKPRLSWVFSETQADSSPGNPPATRGVTQATYQILVASTPEILAKDQGDIWDSGIVKSQEQNQIGTSSTRSIWTPPPGSMQAHATPKPPSSCLWRSGSCRRR